MELSFDAGGVVAVGDLNQFVNLAVKILPGFAGGFCALEITFGAQHHDFFVAGGQNIILPKNWTEQ